MRQPSLPRSAECGPSGKLYKIAVIGTRGIPSSYSGVERACEELYTAMAARGHHVTIYCRRAAVSKKLESYRCVRLKFLPSLRVGHLETLSHSGLALVHILATQRPDIIHIHALASNLFAPFCRMAGLTTVTTVHGLDWQRAKWSGFASEVLKIAERVMVKYTDEIICVSRALQKYYCARYGIKAHYIPNGIRECGERQDFNILRNLGLHRQRYVIYFGRLDPGKRLEDLLRAFGTLATPIRLAIVGSAQYSQEYERDLRSLAEGDERVVFCGQQTGQALQALVSEAMFYVSPSGSEGLPMALLEALSTGTPPVLSDIPAHQEIMRAVAGYDLFFAPGDIAGLAARLTQALKEGDSYRDLICRHRKKILRRYDWKQIVIQTERVYDRAVEGQSGRSTRPLSVARAFARLTGRR